MFDRGLSKATGTAIRLVGKEEIRPLAKTYWRGKRSLGFYLKRLKNLFESSYEKNMAEAWKPMPMRGVTVPV